MLCVRGGKFVDELPQTYSSLTSRHHEIALHEFLILLVVSRDQGNIRIMEKRMETATLQWDIYWVSGRE